MPSACSTGCGSTTSIQRPAGSAKASPAAWSIRGYLANAFVMADLAENGGGTDQWRSGRYGDEIERVMRAASRLHHFRWERGPSTATPT